MADADRVAAPTLGDVIREEAKKVQYQAECYRRDALLLTTRAEELDRVRWDIELAADRWDKAQKKAET